MNLDPTLERTLEDIKASASVVQLSADGAPSIFQTQIISFDSENITLRNSIPFQLISSVIRCRNFQLQAYPLQFTARALASNGVDILFPVEKFHRITETRGIPREQTNSANTLICEFINPFDKSTLIKKPLIDISMSGFSLKTPFESKLFSPGQRLSSVTIKSKRETVRISDTVVVYKRPLVAIDGQNFFQIGLKYLGS